MFQSFLLTVLVVFLSHSFLLIIVLKFLDKLWYRQIIKYRLCLEYLSKICSRSRPEVFCEKGVLRNFAKFTGKHLCQRLWHRCFPVNFAKFLRTFFLQNTSGRLFLYDYLLVHADIIRSIVLSISQTNDISIKVL